MATKFESVWTLCGGATMAMNKSKRLTHYMTVSPIAFRHNLRLSPTPTHAQPRGIRAYRREPLVFHGVLLLKCPSSHHRGCVACQRRTSFSVGYDYCGLVRSAMSRINSGRSAQSTDFSFG